LKPLRSRGSVTGLLVLAVYAWLTGAATRAGADAATAEAAADSAGVGWRTGAAPIPFATSSRSAAAPRLEFDADPLRPRWGDVAFVAAIVAGGAVVAQVDRELTEHATARDAKWQDNLANVARRLGYEGVVIGGAAAWGCAWLSHRDALFVPVQRIDVAIAATGACTFALKQIVGRRRPEDSPGNAKVFKPFSRDDSFPSGHATLAFAAATALDRETSSRWVPAIAYPIAGLVGWSRVHDRKHWTSDVLAGAAIGFGIAWKAENVMRPGPGPAVGLRLELESRPPGTLAAVRATW
jgi:membrane-associated phospholipid phosphatase